MQLASGLRTQLETCYDVKYRHQNFQKQSDFFVLKKHKYFIVPYNRECPIPIPLLDTIKQQIFNNCDEGIY